MFIVSELGEGGMGVVYAAYDPELDRKVAVKMLRPDRIGSGATRTRLLREAQALGKLSHPNVVAIHDVGTHGSDVWLAMEFVAGKTVRTWLSERPRGWREVLEVFKQAARGIEAAHRQGLLHRDIKPANIMLGDDGRVRVADFGLVCREHDAEDHETTGSDSDPLSTEVTVTGSLLGTPAYMAPEQLLGLPADERSDQYALCVALWEALHGQRPFPDESLAARAITVMAGPQLPEAAGARVPGWLRRVVARGLAPRREQRFPGMGALLAALDADPTRRRWAVGLGLGALVGVLGWFGAQFVQRERAIAGCDAAGAAIAGGWNDDARARLRAGLLGTGVRFAATVADKTLPWLDRHADALRETAVETCRAANVEHTLDAAVATQVDACLAESARDLEYLAELLARPGEGAVGRSVVEGAVAAAARLSSPASCQDASRLRARSGLPADEATRAEYHRLRALLTEAAVLENLGTYQDGLERAEAALEGAQAIAWAPLVSAAGAVRGRLLATLARYKEAEETLESAYFAALAAGDDELCAETAGHLATVVGHNLERPVEGLRWARAAQTSLDRAGVATDELRRGAILTASGIIHAKEGDFPQAFAQMEAALRIQQAALGPGHPDVAGSMHNLCTTFRRAGEVRKALPLCEEATAIYAETHGLEHPLSSKPVTELAIHHADRGEFAPAREMFERVLAIEERKLGPDHPRVAGTLANLSQLSSLQGDAVQATNLLVRANAIFTATLGPDDPQTLKSMGSLGRLYQEQGAFDRAEELLTQALAGKEKRLGPDHLEVATSLVTLGNLYRNQGDTAGAIRMAERALQIEQKHLGADNPNIAGTLHSLAVAYAVQKDYTRAIEHIERALKIWEKEPDLHPLPIATAVLNLGRFYELQGQRARGIEAMRRSLAIQDKLRGPDDPNTADVLTALGSALIDSGRADEAGALLERALRLREKHTSDPAELASTRFDLARALWPKRGERPRALGLARQARDGYAERGTVYADSVVEVDRWLERRRG